MNAVWKIPDEYRYDLTQAFGFVASRQGGVNPSLKMSHNGWFCAETEGQIRRLADCKIEILCIEEQREKREYEITFCYRGKSWRGDERTIHINLKADGTCSSRPRFSNYAIADGFLVENAALFNKACMLFVLAALVVLRNRDCYRKVRSGWQKHEENGRKYLDYVGVTTNFVDGSILGRALHPFYHSTPVLMNNIDTEANPVSEELNAAMLHLLRFLSCRQEAALIWTFTIHAVSWRALRFALQIRAPLVECARSLNIFGLGTSSAAQVANVLCPCVWRERRNQRFHSIAAGEAVDLGRATEKITKFARFSDGIYFVADKRTGNITRSAAVKKILTEYTRGESKSMPVFVSSGVFSASELWNVDVSALQLPAEVSLPELRQAGLDILVSYVHFLADLFRGALAASNPAEELFIVNSDLMVFNKRLQKADSLDPDEIPFSEALYHSALWFAYFLQELNYNGRPFLKLVEGEILRRCRSVFLDPQEPVSNEDVTSIFSRWVQSLFVSKGKKFSGIMWNGIEKRSGVEAFYLEGKLVETNFFKCSGIRLTPELRNQLTRDGVLMRRANKGSVVQERKPPEEIRKKYAARLTKAGKANVWVLKKNAVMYFARKNGEEEGHQNVETAK